MIPRWLRPSAYQVVPYLNDLGDICWQVKRRSWLFGLYLCQRGIFGQTMTFRWSEDAVAWVIRHTWEGAREIRRQRARAQIKLPQVIRIPPKRAR